MENKQPPAKRIRKEAAGSMEEEEDDRISQLPEHILQNNILFFLPQKDAVRTCILSKSWRHLGPTRPKIEFCRRLFRGSKEEFIFFVENTLQRYVDQKLPIQEFVLEIWGSYDSESISILDKWIPIVVTNMGAKKFEITANHFPLPPAVFQSESLEELYLEGFEWDQINNNCIVKLPVLKLLSLRFVCIKEETFEKIMSSCPLIQHLAVHTTHGLRTLRVNNARNLKHFDCHVKKASIEIDDAPSLETISLGDYENWNHHKNNIFPRLKSVFLWYVHLGTDSVDNFSSNNCPCLEELKLYYCSGFSEFKLWSCSIKRLIIMISDRQIKAAIDAANMLHFEFSSSFLPSVSFATTSREWKSRIHVGGFSHSSADVLSTWPLKLYEFLKALSQSQISMDIDFYPLMFQDTYDDGGGSCEPAVGVEHLCLCKYYSPSAVPNLLNCLFRICRPKYVGLFHANSQKLAESVWEALVKKEKTRQCDFWKQDLEESSIQVLDENTKEWHSVHEGAVPNNENIRFRLKWTDKSKLAF